jgi:thioredoxin-related protein
LVKIITNFFSLANEKNIANRVVLLVATQKNCKFCVQLKNDFLKPIFLNKIYREKIYLAEFSISNPASNIIDFNNKKTTVASFVDRYRIVGTPTMIFLNNKGVVLHKAIYGLESPDFFFNTIEKAINKSFAVMQK